MPGCNDFSEDLTAWIEGQLPSWQRERIREHLTHCAPCAAEADSLRVAVAWQQQALRTVAALDAIDAMALKARLRRDLAADVDDVAPMWSLRRVWESMWGRLMLAGTAASVAALGVLWVVGPGMVLMPIGLESPPPAVAQHTELFKDYPLIEQLDVLEHFDTVETVPLDDEGASQRG